MEMRSHSGSEVCRGMRRGKIKSVLPSSELSHLSAPSWKRKNNKLIVCVCSRVWFRPPQTAQRAESSARSLLSSSSLLWWQIKVTVDHPTWSSQAPPPPLSARVVPSNQRLCARHIVTKRLTLNKIQSQLRMEEIYRCRKWKHLY